MKKKSGSTRAYIGFDDTDVVGADFGTGKLARRFEQLIPEACALWGVVRQQLLVDPRIPHTSHNGSACVVVHMPDPSFLETLKNRYRRMAQAKALGA
jgi:hypothetical protein